MGKYFCEFLRVPPPPTGKDLCLSRQQQNCTQPYWGSSETIWCPHTWKVIRVLCPKGKPACAGGTFTEKVSGCSEGKAQFYFLVASARGRGDGVSMTYLVKFTVPRPKAAAGSAGAEEAPLFLPTGYTDQKLEGCWVIHEYLKQDRAVFSCCECKQPLCVAQPCNGARWSRSRAPVGER